MSISIPISSFPRPWYLGLPTLVNQGWTLVYQRWLTNVEPWLTNVGFFHFLPHFCHIWWFFNRNCIFYHFWYYPLWKIIKYGKNLGRNEKTYVGNLHRFTYVGNLRHLGYLWRVTHACRLWIGNQLLYTWPVKTWGWH